MKACLLSGCRDGMMDGSSLVGGRVGKTCRGSYMKGGSRQRSIETTSWECVPGLVPNEFRWNMSLTGGNGASRPQPREGGWEGGWECVCQDSGVPQGGLAGGGRQGPGGVGGRVGGRVRKSETVRPPPQGPKGGCEGVCGEGPSHPAGTEYRQNAASSHPHLGVVAEGQAEKPQNRAKRKK